MSIYTALACFTFGDIWYRFIELFLNFQLIMIKNKVTQVFACWYWLTSFFGQIFIALRMIRKWILLIFFILGLFFEIFGLDTQWFVITICLEHERMISFLA